MTRKPSALALSLLAVLGAAGCDRSSPARQGTAVTTAAPQHAATADAREDVCDVYGFAAAQVITARNGFEAVSKNGRDFYEWDEPMVAWNLNDLTTQLDVYSRDVAHRLVDNLTGQLPKSLAAWADKNSAWRHDVPADLRGPLAAWVDATNEWKLAYWNRQSREELKRLEGEYDKARFGEKDKNGAVVRIGANEKCGIKP